MEQDIMFFIKAVVKECLQVLRDTRVVPMCDDYSRGWNSGIDVAIKRLADRYDIEEAK